MHHKHQDNDGKMATNFKSCYDHCMVPLSQPQVTELEFAVPWAWREEFQPQAMVPLGSRNFGSTVASDPMNLATIHMHDRLKSLNKGQYLHTNHDMKRSVHNLWYAVLSYRPSETSLR